MIPPVVQYNPWTPGSRWRASPPQDSSGMLLLITIITITGADTTIVAIMEAAITADGNTTVIDLDGGGILSSGQVAMGSSVATSPTISGFSHA